MPIRQAAGKGGSHLSGECSADRWIALPEGSIVRHSPAASLMKPTHATLAILLALAIGYVAGYFTYLVRFPFRHLRHGPAAAEAMAIPVPAPHPIKAEVAKARKLQAEGKPLEAQKLLRDQLRRYPQAPDAQSARELLGEINTAMFFSDERLYGKTEYIVQRGDSLGRIAQKLNSSPEMIMRANSMDSTLIRPGERLLVPDGDFTLTIDVPKERVVVHHGDGFFKQYPIQAIALPRSSQPKISTRVTATTMWKDGERVAPGASAAEGATPWVHLSRAGYILYGVSEEAGVEPGAVEIGELETAPAACRDHGGR